MSDLEFKFDPLEPVHFHTVREDEETKDLVEGVILGRVVTDSDVPCYWVATTEPSEDGKAFIVSFYSLFEDEMIRVADSVAS